MPQKGVSSLLPDLGRVFRAVEDEMVVESDIAELGSDELDLEWESVKRVKAE